KTGTALGRFRVGTYSPAPDGLTRFGVIDCDGGGRHGNPLADPLGVALQILDRLRRVGITASLERSGSGTGWHVWVFLDSPLPASRVRRLLLAVIPRDTFLANGTTADASANRGLEVFPKQNSIAGDGLGNMVWLPWWHGAAGDGNLFHEVGPDGEIAPFYPDGFDTVTEADLDEALRRVGTAPDGTPARQPAALPPPSPPPP